MDIRYKTVGGERCQNCGRIYKMCWQAPDDIWEPITGGKPGESSGGLICPRCFDALCAANEIPLFWRCRRDDAHWDPMSDHKAAKMIEFLRDCQRRHREWAEFFERNPEEEKSRVESGEWDDAASHREIEQKYEEIIRFLSP